MRSKACGPFVFASLIMLAGCSSSEEETPAAVEDSGAETLGLEVGGSDATSGDTAAPDTSTADTSIMDSTMDSTPLDASSDAGADTRDGGATDALTSDVASDASAPPDAMDSMDAMDAMDAAATPDASDAALGDAGSDATDASGDARDATADGAGDGSDAATDSADVGTFAAAPTCNGVIAAGEYGVHTEGQNQKTIDGVTWYMTWDDTNLYLAASGIEADRPFTLYLEKAPLTPSTGGADSDGTLVGFTYDDARYATLPFRADLVLYAKATYQEYRLADGANGWGPQVTTVGCYQPTVPSGTVRELSIPWSVIGGRPPSLSFFGYVTDPKVDPELPYVYGVVPDMPNAGSGMLGKGEIGLTGAATKFQYVASTAPGSTSKPFATVQP